VRGRAMVGVHCEAAPSGGAGPAGEGGASPSRAADGEGTASGSDSVGASGAFSMVSTTDMSRWPGWRGTY
ncbi:MAG: hypothetical protein ACRDLF_02975, partial [Solirubrobacteraceae bacterium]